MFVRKSSLSNVLKHQQQKLIGKPEMARRNAPDGDRCHGRNIGVAIINEA